MSTDLMLVALSLWAFYVLYVFAMAVYRAQLSGRLSGLHKLLLMPVVLLAALVDLLANLTLASVIFFELPREWLVTARLQRYHADVGYGWRFLIAAWVCDRLLDPFDPRGDHC